MLRLPQEFIVPTDDPLRLLFRERRAVLGFEAVHFALLLELYERSVIVIVANPEFFSPVNTVDFLPERLIAQVVKVQAPDEIFSILRVWIPSRDNFEPCPYCIEVSHVYLMLPLMPVVYIHLLLPSTVTERIRPYLISTIQFRLLTDFLVCAGVDIV